MWILTRIKYCKRKVKRYNRADQCDTGKAHHIYYVKIDSLLGNRICGSYNLLRSCFTGLWFGSLRKYSDNLPFRIRFCTRIFRLGSYYFKLCHYSSAGDVSDVFMLAFVALFSLPVARVIPFSLS